MAGGTAVKAADLIRLWRRALDGRWGYIWGRYGQVWTEANQRAATRVQTVRWGRQWIGHQVADCSGLALSVNAIDALDGIVKWGE